MDDRTVIAQWLGGYKVNVETGEFTLRVDEPERVGGENSGPQPTDLLLASVASCFVLSLAHVARKRSVDVGAIDVVATGTYSGARFSAISIEVSLPLPDDVVAALIREAERVCYVTNTLRRPPEITVLGVASH